MNARMRTYQEVLFMCLVKNTRSSRLFCDLLRPNAQICSLSEVAGERSEVAGDLAKSRSNLALERGFFVRVFV